MKKIVFVFASLILFSVNALAQIGVNDLIRPRKVAEASAVNSVNKSSAFELERQAFALLNDKRNEQGLSPLVWDEDVAKVARVHSQNMANYKFFSHKGLDGSLVSDRADKLGLSKWRLIGENIAYLRGYRNPVEFAVRCWMESASHKQNLLNTNWKQSAVGVAVTDDGTYYFTQVFLLRK